MYTDESVRRLGRTERVTVGVAACALVLEVQCEWSPVSSHTQYEEASESLGVLKARNLGAITICYSPYYCFLTYRPHRTCLLESSSVRPG